MPCVYEVVLNLSCLQRFTMWTINRDWNSRPSPNTMTSDDEAADWRVNWPCLLLCYWLCSLNVRVGGFLPVLFSCFCLCVMRFLLAIYLCPQGRRLVGSPLHQHRREWLHPQQLCGPSWFHTSWRVRSKICTFLRFFIKLWLSSGFLFLLLVSLLFTILPPSCWLRWK